MHSSQSSFPFGAESIVRSTTASVTATATASLFLLPALVSSNHHLRHAHHSPHMTFDLEPPATDEGEGDEEPLEPLGVSSSSTSDLLLSFPTFSHNNFTTASSSSFDLFQDNSTSLIILNSSAVTTEVPPGHVTAKGVGTLYGIIVPLMISCCLVTCLVNLIIVASARWCRKPMSPTLYFSISLALADAYASFFLGLGLVINSLLPVVYGVDIPNKCFALTVEAFR